MTEATYSTTRLIATEPPEGASESWRPAAGEHVLAGGLRTQGKFKKNHPGKPLITVITVVFNGSASVEATIRSVINQSYDNIEYIVIDGGSTDRTLEIVRDYDHAIDYWLSEVDGGIYDAMNKGLSLASGDWINFMNAGDFFSEDATVQQVFSDEAIYAAYDCIYSDTMFNCRSGLKRVTCDLNKRRIIHQSIFYKKELHRVAGPYLVAPGITISDYLFFMLLRERRWLKHPHPICTYSPYGVTSGSDAYKQKVAVDLMLGCTSRVTAAFLVLCHPVYHALKRCLKA